MPSVDPWIIVPARINSPRVPRVNLRMLAGRPLISHVLSTAREVTSANRLIVLTDDDEIDEVARFDGAQVIRLRSDDFHYQSSMEVVAQQFDAMAQLGASDEDVFLIIQPNWPLLTAESVREAARAVAEGSASVATVVLDDRPGWSTDERGASVRLLAPIARQVAAIEAARWRDFRLNQFDGEAPVTLLTLNERESVGIRTFADFVAAEYWLGRKSVVIRTDAGRHMGMGHVYRALALAHELAQHSILIVTSSAEPLGGTFFERHPFEHVAVSSDDEFLNIVTQRNADLIVLDMLDTDESLVESLSVEASGPKIVSFEDHGSGAHLVDLLVCDIYENPSVSRDRQMVGISNALLAPTFESLPRQARESAEVEEILVLFGGTDPADLAEKSLRALNRIGFTGHVTVVRGLGADPIDVTNLALDVTVRTDVSNMAELMSTADLALSSAGRTLAELATLGVPTVCMAQNTKELRHTHSTVDHGVVLLGLGTEVRDEALQATLTQLIGDSRARAALRSAALDATRGRTNAAVVDEILRRTGLVQVSGPPRKG